MSAEKKGFYGRPVGCGAITSTPTARPAPTEFGSAARSYCIMEATAARRATPDLFPPGELDEKRRSSVYGLVNKALQDLVCSRYGEGTWERIRRNAGVDVDLFVNMEAYPDDITHK